MKPKSPFSHVLGIAITLLLLGGLGAYWPTLVDADVPDSSLAPRATVGDAITYQGYLADQDDVPLDGPFTMRFIIFNDPVAGATLWDSGDINVDVVDGLFAVRLPTDTDIFNGEELWLSQTVNGEVLSPRQEILPTPMAHTLRPGAIIKGTASAFPNNYSLEVQTNNDLFAFNRGAIAGKTTTGNAIYGLAENGRAIYGQTQDGYAVYGFDGGSNPNQGYAGYFYSTNGVGVYGYSGANRTHPNILAPGVYGQSNQGVGVYGRGDTSNSFSFYNEGGYFEGGKGLFARGTDSADEQGYGARIFSTNYRGLYVQGNSSYFDAYFGGQRGISTNGVVDRSSSVQSLVVNGGDSPIESGDLVAMVGVVYSLEDGQPMLAVAKVDATNRNAVIGVAKEAIVATPVSSEDGGEYVDFAPATGAIAPDSFLVIITGGLAPAVNVTGLTSVTGGAIGDRVSLANDGGMRVAAGESDDIVIGKMAGPVDELNGTIPMFIDID